MATNAEIKSLLEKAGIPFVEISVFGIVNRHIHIFCKSLNATNKFSSILTRMGCKMVKIVPSMRYNKINSHSCLMPSSYRVHHLYGKI